MHISYLSSAPPPPEKSMCVRNDASSPIPNASSSNPGRWNNKLRVNEFRVIRGQWPKRPAAIRAINMDKCRCIRSILRHM